MARELYNMCLVSQRIGTLEARRIVWLEDGGDRWFNGVGSRSWHSKSKDDIVLSSARVSDDSELDQTLTSTWLEYLKSSTDDTLDCAWLSPEGKPFYCQYAQHDSFAYVFLDYDVSELEEAGWGRLHRDNAQSEWSAHFGFSSYMSDRYCEPTDAQATWLLEQLEKLDKTTLKYV